MRHRDVRTSAARPVRGRRRLWGRRSASRGPRATAPAATTAGARASARGCSGAWAAVRTTTSDAHVWTPCGACGPCGSAPPGVAAGAVTAAGVGRWVSSVSACATAHRMITSSRAPWIRVPSRRGHGEPDRVPWKCDVVRKGGGTEPPCGRRSSGRGGGKRRAWVGEGGIDEPDRDARHVGHAVLVPPRGTPAERLPPPVRPGPERWRKGRMGNPAAATPAGPRTLSAPPPTPCAVRRPCDRL